MDGLSLNNLALNRDNTSKENAINSENLANTRSAGDNSIDQLEKKGEIEGGDHENTSASGGFSENLTEDEFNDGYESEDEEEEIYDEYTTDGGHLTEKGYEVLTKQITPVVDKILKPEINNWHIKFFMII